MKRKTMTDYAKIARKSEENNALRNEFRGYLKANGLERNEQNAHIFAFGKTYYSDDRIKLVNMLMSGIWFE